MTTSSSSTTTTTFQESIDKNHPRNWLTRQQLNSLFQDSENQEINTNSRETKKMLQIELPEKYAWVFLGILIVVLIYFLGKGINSLSKKYKIWQENRLRNRFVKNVTNTEFMSSPTISMVGSKCSNCGCGKQASTRPALSSAPRNISSQHGLSLPKVHSVHSARTGSTTCKPQTLPFKMDSHIGMTSPRTESSKIHFNFNNRVTKKKISRENDLVGNSIHILEQMSAEPSKQPNRPKIDFTNGNHQMNLPMHMDLHNQISSPPNIGSHFHQTQQQQQQHNNNGSGIPNFGIGGNNDNMGKFDISQISALQKNLQQHGHQNLYQMHSVPPVMEHQNHQQNIDDQNENHLGHLKNNSNTNKTDHSDPNSLTLGKRSVASIETRNSYIIRKFLMSNKGRILDTAAQLVGPNGTLKSKLSKIDMNDLAAQAKLEALISGSTRSNSSEF